MVAPVDSQRLTPEFDAFKEELRRKSAARSAGTTARKSLPDIFGAFAEGRRDGRDAGAGSAAAGASADHRESGGVFTPDREALARDLAVLDDLIATRAVSIEQLAAGNGRMENVVPKRDVLIDSPEAGPLPLDMAEFESAERGRRWGRDGGSDAGSRRAAYIVVGVVGVGLASLVLMLGLGEDDGARRRTALAASPKTASAITPSAEILREAPPQETPDAGPLRTPDDASAEGAPQAAPAPIAAEGKEIAAHAPAPQAPPPAAEASRPGPKEAAAAPPSPPAAKSVSATPPAAKTVSSAPAPAPRAQQAAAPASVAQKPARSVAAAKPVVQRERASVARAAAPAAAAPAGVAEPAPPPPAAVHVEAAPPEPASSSLLSLSTPLNLMKRATGAVTGSVSGVARRWGL